MSESAREPRPEAGRRLTVLYVLALSTVAFLSLGAQALIQRQLDTGESDSRVINVAGRQRMLSQRLAKASLRIAATDGPARARAIAELGQTLDAWSNSHLALQSGDEAAGLPGSPSRDVRRLYAEIEPSFAAMHAAAAALLDSPDGDPGAPALVEAIQSNEAAFLSGMDRVVSQYVVEAEARVARLRSLEFAILACTLLVLLAEGLLVFRPAVARITQTVARLELLSDRLARAKTEAERANEAKTRFVANVSHELRTPMTAVLGMTELAREAEDPSKRDHYLRVVEEAGEDLLSLLNDLIDIARVDIDRIDLAAVPFDPVEVAQRVERLLRQAALDKGIGLTVQAPERAPRLLGDPQRLSQVLINLVGNGIKWTDRGGVRLIVACDEAAEGRCKVRYLVSDSGLGMAPEDTRRVFEPFTQLQHESSGARGGAGLGLAICRRLVEAMGGVILLDSVPGEGTVASVTLGLPLAPRGGEIARPAPVESAAPQSILVVEDTEANRLLLRTILEQAGHAVTLAEDGERALELVRESTYDLAIVDLQLPGIDGRQTAAGVVEACADRGVAAPRLACLTANTSPAEASDRGPFEVWMTKPIKREQLLAAVSARPAVSDEPVVPTEDLQDELWRVFAEHAPADLAKLESAVGAGDHATVRVVAHRMKGQVAYFDRGLERLLGDLERFAEQGSQALIESTGREAVLAIQAALENHS